MKTVITNDDIRTKFVEVDVRIVGKPIFGKDVGEGNILPRVWACVVVKLNGEILAGGELSSTVFKWELMTWTNETNVRLDDGKLIGSVNHLERDDFQIEDFASKVIYDIVRSKERSIVEQLDHLHIKNFKKLKSL